MSPLKIFNEEAFFFSLILFLKSIIGKTLFAADKPWLRPMLSVASDRTG